MRNSKLHNQKRRYAIVVNKEDQSRLFDMLGCKPTKDLWYDAHADAGHAAHQRKCKYSLLLTNTELMLIKISLHCEVYPK